MCGEEHPRTDRAGEAMAALFDHHRAVGCIYFERQANEQTKVTLNTAIIPDRPGHDVFSSAHQLHIHKYGAVPSGISNPVLFSTIFEDNGQIASTSKLLLSAVEGGVMGRGVSIVNASNNVLAAGIIGWN